MAKNIAVSISCYMLKLCQCQYIKKKKNSMV
jgi:hypothetical protein